MKKLLLFLLFFFFITPKALASDKFSTSYKVVYSVSETGNTQVSSNVELTNNTSDYYVSRYSIKTGFKNVEDISVKDEGGNVSFQTAKDDLGTQISLNFNQNVVGIDKTKKFTITYRTNEIAKASGDIWEINIPGFSGQEDYQSFSAEVKVPSSFGRASIIKPATPDSKTIGKNDLVFSKKDLGRSGIAIYYGDHQIYDFNLSYHLSNKNILPSTTEIALPSNNNYQDIYISSITPRPNNVYLDKDGNWLAQFKLSPGSKQDVKVTGKASVNFLPRKENITQDEINIFTLPQKYWEVNDPKIQTLAKKLKTPKAIFDYVVNNLEYDSSRVSDKQVRAGALGVLNDKASAVCLEFSDLFIALSRAAGIPAREVEGFANTNNSANRPLSLEKDVLHAWPQYYDFNKKAWIMVDPTWQNTTGGTDYFDVFDFDHLSFVINGENSTYPVPAGGYKLTDNASQDVFVEPGKFFPSTTPIITAKIETPRSQLAGLRNGGKIIVTNDSGVLAPAQSITLESQTLEPGKQTLYVDAIPPYGKRTISFGFNPRPILTNETDEAKIMIGKKVIVAQISIVPFYKNVYFYITGGVLIGIIGVFLFAVTRKSGRIPVS
jgi:transglutaminase-like putative cysteine protease